MGTNRKTLDQAMEAIAALTVLVIAIKAIKIISDTLLKHPLIGIPFALFFSFYGFIFWISNDKFSTLFAVVGLALILSSYISAIQLLTFWLSILLLGFISSILISFVSQGFADGIENYGFFIWQVLGFTGCFFIGVAGVKSPDVEPEHNPSRWPYVVAMSYAALLLLPLFLHMFFDRRYDGKAAGHVYCKTVNISFENLGVICGPNGMQEYTFYSRGNK